MRDRRSFLHLPFNILRTTLLLGSSGIALLLVLAFVNLWQFGWNWVRDMDNWLSLKQMPPKIAPSTVILQQVRGVSELTTTVFVMETVVPTFQERQLGKVMIGQSRLLYVAHGEVRAGIDLSQLDDRAIQLDGDRLVVTLPEPKILDKKIDIEKSKIYDYDRGFLNLGPDTAPQLLEFAQRQTLDKLLISACDQGILDRANDQAEVVLLGLLRNQGLGSVEIRTTAPTMCGISQG